MSLRINHHTALKNVYQNFSGKEENSEQTVNFLSKNLPGNVRSKDSGLPSLSEHIRSKMTGFLVENPLPEEINLILRKAGKNLGKINQLLTGLRQLAIHAANEVYENRDLLEADQAALITALDRINLIAASTKVGEHTLFDGSFDIHGSAIGKGLSYISGSSKTNSSESGGFPVEITQLASRSKITGSCPLNRELIDSEEKITIQLDDKVVEVVTKPGENAREFVARLNEQFTDNAILLKAGVDSHERLTISHRKYGSKPGFEVTSTTAGVLSDFPDVPMIVKNGQDLKGTINGEPADGVGQFLIAASGTTAEDLIVRYDERIALETTEERQQFRAINQSSGLEVGRIYIRSNALTVPASGNLKAGYKLLLPNLSTFCLGLNKRNECGFLSLQDIDLRLKNGPQSALKLVEKTLEEIKRVQNKLNYAYRSSLETNIATLGIAKENQVNVTSEIDEMDFVSQISEMTKHQILSQASMALMAQASQSPNKVLSLLS